MIIERHQGRATSDKQNAQGTKCAREVATGTTKNQVGLDIETTNKHFRKIGILIDYLCKQVPNLVRLDIDGYLSVNDRDERDDREAYTVEQMLELFSLPPWTGCLDARNRFVKGSKRFADALVFVLLMVWYTGVRREELCKLLVSEIHNFSGIWYLDIKNSEAGRIKNARSKRYVVICDELIRLGFVDYFQAIKAAGYTALFPELLTERGVAKKGDVFYRVWWVKVKPHMPSLLPGQAFHSARHGFDTELKEQDVFPEDREDAAGRKSNRGETDRYGKATRLKKLTALFNKVPIVTLHLDPFLPTELLSKELLQPRKARRKLS
jgi:integrase